MGGQDKTFQLTLLAAEKFARGVSEAEYEWMPMSRDHSESLAVGNYIMPLFRGSGRCVVHIHIIEQV